MTMAFLKNKQIILVGVLGIVLLIAIVVFMGASTKNKSRPEQEFNISSFGMLMPLNDAMAQSSDVNALAQKLLAYDEVVLFVNYPQVNSDMASLMFLWSGMTRAELKKLGGQRAIAVFLRHVYGLPKDEPIIGNPLLEGNPWGDLFNRFKAQILMQGQGHKIYDGLAYYDNEQNQMVVRADLSKEFMNGFAEFLKTQNSKKRKKYFNNFLLFIRDTKGFNNLSKKDKAMIKTLQGIK